MNIEYNIFNFFYIEHKLIVLLKNKQKLRNLRNKSIVLFSIKKNFKYYTFVKF